MGCRFHEVEELKAIGGDVEVYLEAQIHGVARTIICEGVASRATLALEERYFRTTPERHAKLNEKHVMEGLTILNMVVTPSLASSLLTSTIMIYVHGTRCWLCRTQAKECRTIIL